MIGTGTNDNSNPVSTGSKSSDGIARSSLLHPGRPRVTRLSRKVLAGGTASALVLLF